MKRIILFLAILALAVPAFGSGFDIEGGLGVDSIRISDYFELNGTNHPFHLGFRRQPVFSGGRRYAGISQSDIRLRPGRRGWPGLCRK